jgi:hypothetical protein
MQACPFCLECRDKNAIPAPTLQDCQCSWYSLADLVHLANYPTSISRLSLPNELLKRVSIDSVNLMPLLINTLEGLAPLSVKSFKNGLGTNRLIQELSLKSNGLALLASDRSLRQPYTDGEGDNCIP